MTEGLLEVKDLRAYYKTPSGPVRAVDGVSFTLQRGEIFGIAGESGCGKSTLTKAVLRLLKEPAYIDGGEALFEGRDLLRLDEEAIRKLRGREISYIPQSSMNALNPVMRVRNQMVDIILAHGNSSKKMAKDRASELLAALGLPQRSARMYPHELSGGMRQRAVIGVAITLSPKLIVADEPTTALDVVTQRRILRVLSEIKERLGASIVLITHDMAVHAEIVDRLMVMYAGEVAEIGSVYDLFENPLHPYTEVLVEAIPSIEGRREIKGLSGRPPSLLKPPPGCRFHPRCPYAMERCTVEAPTLRETGPGRLVACHLHGE